MEVLSCTKFWDLVESGNFGPGSIWEIRGIRSSPSPLLPITVSRSLVSCILRISQVHPGLVVPPDFDPCCPQLPTSFSGFLHPAAQNPSKPVTVCEPGAKSKFSKHNLGRGGGLWTVSGADPFGLVVMDCRSAGFVLGGWNVGRHAVHHATPPLPPPDKG